MKEVQPIRDPGIKMLRNGRWQVMSEPLNYDRFFAGIGLAASFAQAWRTDHPEEEIGLIPCADGGSMLDEWQPGCALFDHAVMQAKLAQRISVIDGILWHQGETDCPSERVICYEKKLDGIVAELRRQLELPNVPFIVGGLGDYLPECPLHDYFVNAPKVTAALLHFAETHEHTLFVTAKGLTCNPDHLHFNAISQRIFGIRYYSSYVNQVNVMEPLPNEEEVVRQQNEYVEIPLEEKQRMLKQQLDEGKIDKQMYDRLVDALISTM
ncbi:MAG: sialate O-acetylesterase [Lachnospiraceae bacterium]|nr:sialate O-acetylesterase [Lachnospiraceae bacterium]